MYYDLFSVSIFVFLSLWFNCAKCLRKIHSTYTYMCIYTELFIHRYVSIVFIFSFISKFNFISYSLSLYICCLSIIFPSHRHQGFCMVWFICNKTVLTIDVWDFSLLYISCIYVYIFRNVLNCHLNKINIMFSFTIISNFANHLDLNDIVNWVTPSSTFEEDRNCGKQPL